MERGTGRGDHSRHDPRVAEALRLWRALEDRPQPLTLPAEALGLLLWEHRAGRLDDAALDEQIGALLTDVLGLGFRLGWAAGRDARLP